MKSILTKTIASLALGGGLFFLAQSCTESQGKNNPIPRTTEPVPVRVTTLAKSDAGQTIVTSGRLTTDDETVLAFKTGGIINAVFVDEGQKISKGQLLATLDLTEINTFVAQAKSGFDKAVRDLERARNLYADSVATLEQLQNAETAFDVAKQQYDAAVFNRSHSQIKAPASGYVMKKFVNAGQVVGIGDPILRTNGAGNGQWLLRAGVSDKQWSSIRIGDNATITVDAFPGKSFSGRVVRKSESADPASGAFAVEIEVSSDKLRFASGMFASASIEGAQRVTSWSVPYDAVLDANGDEGFVFVTDDGKKARKASVKIGSFNGSSVQIASGLEGATTLIVSGSAYLTDQSPITIVK